MEFLMEYDFWSPFPDFLSFLGAQGPFLIDTIKSYDVTVMCLVSYFFADF